MPTLQYRSAFPSVTAAGDGQPAAVACEPVLEQGMRRVLQLMDDGRLGDASIAVDTLNYTPSLSTPRICTAWLWLVKMVICCQAGDVLMAVNAAECSLRALSDIPQKKTDDFLAVLAALLYQLCATHTTAGDTSRAVKELAKAQGLYQRLAKKDPARFAAMLSQAMAAGITLFSTKRQLQSLLTHYQDVCDSMTAQAEAGAPLDTEAFVTALTALADVELQMGNTREAVRHYTKAVKSHKRLHSEFGLDELKMEIKLASALMRIVKDRDKAVALLNTLQTAARQLEAKEQLAEIDTLLTAQKKTSSIMQMLKGIF